MFITSIPNTRDKTSTLISGPQLGADPDTSALKALLQLKDSSLDEFINLVESARGAASSETTTENCTQNDGDRLSMDTLSLSDTSMMAHEVDRQLEKSTPESQDGNSGYCVSPADSSTN